MTQKPALVWFRRDLRLADNPALDAARATGGPVVALYVHDPGRFFAPGSAQRWFIHHALEALSDGLDQLGAPLLIRRGDEAACVESVARETGAEAVFWNRRYSPEEVAADTSIKAALTAGGVSVKTFNGSLLREPWEVKSKTDGPYRVFTPFWKTLSSLGPSRPFIAATPKRRTPLPVTKASRDSVSALDFLPRNPDWAAQFREFWTPNEKGAEQALETFLDGPAERYAEKRDFPATRTTSRLSPHLAVGTISPLAVWNATQRAIASEMISERDGEKFLSEIAWREFSCHLLYHNPEMTTAPLRPDFSAFPWRKDKKAFRAWTRGETGVPIVDAGMRQLWRTGWMHNRVRMIAASFLVKNLLVPWQWGERWFWDTLVDADPASNVASWQWVAGCGADAAPYFRIFNPATQAEKFDPDGAYIAQFAAPQHVKEPIVDLAQSRRRALEAYERMKNAAA